MNGRVGLCDDVTIVPVGGLDKVATFISLLRGNKLNMVCLLDTFTDQKGKKRLEDLIKDKIIKENQVKFFDQYIDRLSVADIEDMFEIDEYLNLFNKEFDKEFTKINSTDIDNTKAIIPQINKIINRTRFNHYRPSRYLTSLCVDKDYFSIETLMSPVHFKGSVFFKFSSIGFFSNICAISISNLCLACLSVSTICFLKVLFINIIIYSTFF